MQTIIPKCNTIALPAYSEGVIIMIKVIRQWRIQGGFLVARKPPPPQVMIFLIRGG